MSGMTEACTVCGKQFEVQFRYQMEEHEQGFAFYCSHPCYQAALSGKHQGGVHCDACRKQFALDLVSQVVKIGNERRYACSPSCREQLLEEEKGTKLGEFVLSSSPSSSSVSAVEVESKRENPDREQGSCLSDPIQTKTEERISKRKLYGPSRLAIFNHKGGTGKTTTSVSIAAGLALSGVRVLLVDTDSQGNVGVSFQVKVERSLYHLLIMGVVVQDTRVQVRPNLDIVPSDESLAAAELYLAGRKNRDRILRERLAPFEQDYDIIILDCSPSLSLLNQNALVFAEGILVPVACDFLSLVGVRQVIRTLKNVNSLLRHPIKIFGVLPTFYDARARICRDAMDTLKQHFGARCLPPIRATIKVKEAPSQGRTIFEHAPDSHAAEDYRRTVSFIMEGPAGFSPCEREKREEDGQASLRLGSKNPWLTE
ncbi:hypothetical protein BCY86_05665 [Pajaroellobacter abortibovis]|uniref:AAA domain-containing protein n=2 Tax=Pajaroellobacter abortibovis TaxID=1882918 RepID=A0A1L6MXE7_9BACT|nr:hypothetical protein BCY86_05665 [Pajaroellobacter abortibovis]